MAALRTGHSRAFAPNDNHCAKETKALVQHMRSSPPQSAPSPLLGLAEHTLSSALPLLTSLTLRKESEKGESDLNKPFAFFQFAASPR